MDETQPQGSAAAAELKIDATLIAKLNLADFQNAVPLVRDLWLINETDQTHEQVELVLTSDPPFLKPRRWRIDTLAAGSRYPIRDMDVTLDGGMLARLTEAETAAVSLALRKVDADASAPALAQRDIRLELLPRNQWGGISHLPDLVAAFVQPNDPAVDRLLKRTAEVLRQNDRNPALDGYAGGAKRAWELASAIWGATAGMQLDYALPPASFEQSGQKVRSPSQIESSELGTCFDLSKKPDETNLSNALTEALPPISTDLLADVADALNQLEEYRRELEEYEALERAVGQFNQRYQRYAATQARRRARSLRSAQTGFDNASRELNDGRLGLEAARAAETGATQAQQRAENTLAGHRSRLDELQNDPAMTDAKALDKAAADAERQQRDAGAARTERQRRQTRFEQEQQATRQRAQRAEDAGHALAEARTQASAAAETAGLASNYCASPLAHGEAATLTSPALASAQQDLRHTAAARREQVAHLQRRCDEAEQAAQKRVRAQDLRDERADEAEAAAARREEADVAVERQGQHLLEAWQSHLDAAQQLQVPDSGDVLETLAAWTASLHGDNPARAALHRAQQAASLRLAQRQAMLQTEQQALEQEQATLHAERTRLQSGEDALEPRAEPGVAGLHRTRPRAGRTRPRRAPSALPDDRQTRTTGALDDPGHPPTGHGIARSRPSELTARRAGTPRRSHRRQDAAAPGTAGTLGRRDRLGRCVPAAAGLVEHIVSPAAAQAPESCPGKCHAIVERRRQRAACSSSAGAAPLTIGGQPARRRPCPRRWATGGRPRARRLAALRTAAPDKPRNQGEPRRCSKSRRHGGASTRHLGTCRHPGQRIGQARTLSQSAGGHLPRSAGASRRAVVHFAAAITSSQPDLVRRRSHRPCLREPQLPRHRSRSVGR